VPDAALLNPVETPHLRRGPGSPSGMRVATGLADTGDLSVFIRVHLWFPSRLEPQMNTDEHGSSSGGNTKAQGAGRGTVRLAVARQHPTAMLPVRSSVHGGAWLPCLPSPPVSPVVHLSFQAPRELGGGNHDAHRSGFTRRVKFARTTAIPNIPRNQQFCHEWDRVSRRSWSCPKSFALPPCLPGRGHLVPDRL